MGIRDWFRRLRKDRPALAAPAQGAIDSLVTNQRALPGNVAQLMDPDRPRLLGHGDPLCRGDWVRTFKHQLERIPVTDSFVFSLEGPWGAGKTSVLDTLEVDLAGPTTAVLRFNPWLFAGADDLVGSFFRELAAQLHNNKQPRLRAMAAVFGGLAAALGAVGAAAGGPVVAALATVLRSSSAALKQASELQHPPSLLETKRAFEKQLTSSQLRIIVLVDDLERLTGREVLEVLRAIRAIADLPGLIYVLAFDREQLVRSLRTVGEEATFLDKIIQVPMRLPTPPADALERLVSEKLDRVLEQVQHTEVDTHRWTEIAFKVVYRYVKTPRDAARLANAVGLALVHVGARVALEDVIALESLRMFEPEFFGELRRYRAFLTSGEDAHVELVRATARHNRERSTRGGSAPSTPTTRTSLLATAKDGGIAADALTLLFPALGEFDGLPHGGGFDRQRGRRDRRVAVTQVFDLYFEAEPRADFVDLAFIATLSEATVADVERLLAPITGAQLEYVFNTLGDHAPRLLERNDLVAFVRALLSQATRLPRRDADFIVGRPEAAPARLVYRLLRELPDADARQRFLSGLLDQLPAKLAPIAADVIVTIEREATQHLDITEGQLRAFHDELRASIRSLDIDAFLEARNHVWLIDFAYQPEQGEHQEGLQRLLDDERVFSAFVRESFTRRRYSNGPIVLEYRGELFAHLFPTEQELRARLEALVHSADLPALELEALRRALTSGHTLLGSAPEEEPEPE